MTATADKIIDHYNDIRMELRPNKNRHSGLRYSRKKDREAAFSFLAWCTQQELHPLHFLRFALEDAARKQRGAPALASLQSDSFAGFYRANRIEDSILAYERTVRPVYDLVGRDNAGLYTKVRDLMIPPMPSDECFRGRHLRVQRSEVCRRERRFAGFGFDPRSTSCRTCPSKFGCASDLNSEMGFDVSALRLNRFRELPESVRRIAEASTELL